MSEENYKGLKKQLETHSLDIASQLNILEIAYGSQQQLQKYKENKFIEIAPLDLAMHFHNTYEKLAPSFGYKTREDTKQFDINSNNGQLMVAVCETILKDVLQILN